MRFVVVPDHIVNLNDPSRLQLYCQIYLAIVMCQKINVKQLSTTSGIPYGQVYRLKKSAEESFRKASRKHNGNGMKTKRKQDENKSSYNAEVIELHSLKDENKMKTNENPVKTPRKQGAYKSRKPETLRLVIEKEIEKEIVNLLTIEEILQLSPHERERYILNNQQQLKQQGII